MWKFTRPSHDTYFTPTLPIYHTRAAGMYIHILQKYMYDRMMYRSGLLQGGPAVNIFIYDRAICSKNSRTINKQIRSSINKTRIII